MGSSLCQLPVLPGRLEGSVFRPLLAEDLPLDEPKEQTLSGGVGSGHLTGDTPATAGTLASLLH